MKKTFLLIFLSWLLFFIVTPPLHTPDETEHYENSFWLSRFIYPYQPKDKSKPVLFVDNLMDLYLPFNVNKIKNSPLKHATYDERQIRKIRPTTLQSYHPPFYFFLISLSHHVSNAFRLDYISRFYLARIFSLFFYFGIVYFCYKILKLLFNKETIIIPLLLFFSLNPLVVKTGVGINPDIGMTFFSILFLYLIIKWQKERLITLKQTIILAVIAVLATLSKISGLFTLFIFPIYVYLKNKLKKSSFILYALFFMLFILLVSPWFFLNLSRYHKLVPPAFSFAEYRQLQPHNIIQAMILSAFEFRHTIMHYTGFLGPTNNINPPKLFFMSYTIIVSIFFLLGLVFLLRNINKYRNFLWIIIHFLSLVAFLFFLGVYFKKSGFSWDLQGRYFIAGFFPITIFIYYGILLLVRKKSEIVTRILFLGGLMHFYYILFLVYIPFYYSWKNLFQDLGTLYPFFNFLFVGGFALHVLLSFSMTRKLFRPLSK